MKYDSCARVDSKVRPGVAFVISKMSFVRRMDLIRGIRELSLKCEFLNAGESSVEKLEAALLAAEIDRLYVSWGLQDLTELEVDGVAATPSCWHRAVPKTCSAKPCRSSRPNAVYRRKKGKTNCRLPLSTFQRSRMEVRRLPEIRAGTQTKMRLAAGGSRSTGTNRMGQETGGD
jgi:hypothetical protein